MYCMSCDALALKRQIQKDKYTNKPNWKVTTYKEITKTCQMAFKVLFTGNCTKFQNLKGILKA